MSDKPQGKDFEGDAPQMKDSNWISCDDLDIIGGSGTVTITRVAEDDVTFEGGREEHVYWVEFKETQKGLIINATNRETLIRLFGKKKPNPSWQGKKVELYVDDNVQFRGKRVRGVRVREHKGGT